MTREELEKVRAELLRWKGEILESKGEAVKEMAKEGEELTFSDPSDRATYEEESTMLLKIKDREAKLVMKIEDTLKRLDDGSYGVCEECGEMIPFERLLARPVTTLCIVCKTEQEEREHK